MSVGRARRDDSDVAERHVAAALDGNRTISTAIGLLMAEHRVTRADALELMRSQSRGTNVKVSAVAAEVVRVFELRCH